MSWNSYYKEVRNKNPLKWPDVQMIRLVNKIDFNSNPKVLDLACGEGRNLRYFIENNFDVTAVEQSKEALDIVKSLYKIDDDRLICSDALEALISFDENSFNLILCWGLMQYIKEPSDLLKNMYRILDKDSHLIISFNSNKDKRNSVDTIKHYYSEEEIKELIKSSNLNIIDFGRIDNSFITDKKIESFYWALLKK